MPWEQFPDNAEVFLLPPLLTVTMMFNICYKGDSLGAAHSPPPPT